MLNILFSILIMISILLYFINETKDSIKICIQKYYGFRDINESISKQDSPDNELSTDHMSVLSA